MPSKTTCITTKRKYASGLNSICGALRNLVPFVQFKKREKHPWRSVTLLKVTLLHGCFSRFLHCTNGTKSRNESHMHKIQHTK